MKNILMIGTGGTIASEMTPDGLTPELSPTQLLRYVPAIRDLCHVDCVNLFSIDSTNITPTTTALSSATAPTPWPTPPPR